MARTILLVEDAETSLNLIATVLTKQGFDVIKAKDTIEAEREWNMPDRSFDLLIADVKLPGGGDGFTLADKLLEQRPNVPVLFISGDRDCFASPSIRNFADSPFIAKPFDVKQMIAAVDKVLNPSGRSGS